MFSLDAACLLLIHFSKGNRTTVLMYQGMVHSNTRLSTQKGYSNSPQEILTSSCRHGGLLPVQVRVQLFYIYVSLV